MFDIAVLLARLLMGGAFIVWGTMKLRGGEAELVPVLKAMHMPDAKGLAYLVGLCEFLGGVGVVLGFPLVLFSLALGLWCLVTAYIGHKGDTNQMLAHTCMAGGFFTLASSGAGTLALFGGHPEGVFALLP